MQQSLTVAGTAALPFMATSAFGIDVQSEMGLVIVASILGGLASGLFSLRRSITNGEKAAIGLINVLLGVIAGVAFGAFGASSVEAIPFMGGLSKPFAALLLALLGAQITERLLDGSIVTILINIFKNRTGGSK